MNLYLDASALIKRYISETGSEQVNALIANAESVGMAVISRAEVAATFAKVVRMQLLEHKAALALLQNFRNDWQDWVRIELTENLVARADALAWEHSLRGYDAVHLAAALVWQETLGGSVTLATYDESLWQSAEREGLIPFPVDLPSHSKSQK